jgi:glycosyltransferase involved in cell wall biosynthesis
MKVGIVTSLANKLLQYRSELVSTILERNHNLTVLGCEPAEECHPVLSPHSVQYIELPFPRYNINPITEFGFILKAVNIFKSLQIDALLIYGIRLAPGISVAAYLAGIRRIYTVINGTGTLFHMPGIKGSLARFISYPLLLTGLHMCKCVFFQNEDDRGRLLRMGLVNRKKTCIVNGSGVNLEKYKPKPLPKKHMFLFVGRLLRDKGVNEFLSAAKIVKKAHPGARFVLVGAYDENTTAIPKEIIESFINQKIVEHIEWSDRIADYLEACYTFVLPSYHEGTPRTVLEAMASGRPIITTDAPGCRATVINGINGFLVPVRDVELLAEKMIWMIENRCEAEKMGRKSLRICREKYDVHKVNKTILDTMKL